MSIERDGSVLVGGELRDGGNPLLDLCRHLRILIADELLEELHERGTRLEQLGGMGPQRGEAVGGGDTPSLGPEQVEARFPCLEEAVGDATRCL